MCNKAARTHLHHKVMLKRWSLDYLNENVLLINIVFAFIVSAYHQCHNGCEDEASRDVTSERCYKSSRSLHCHCYSTAGGLKWQRALNLSRQTWQFDTFKIFVRITPLKVFMSQFLYT